MRRTPLPISMALALGLAIAPSALAAERVEVLAVTASSTDGMLMDAVDGDPDTAWHNKHEGEKDAWLAVRFAEPARLRGVRLNTGGMPSEVRCDVETSLDGLTYQTVLDDQRVTQDRPVEWLFPRKVTALYVRVRFTYTGNGQAPRFQVRELEALPATGG